MLPFLPAITQVAPSPAPLAPIESRLPIREVSVFKDGNALFLHEGTVALDSGGESVTLDYLPVPILGTFWVYSPQKSVVVRQVRAARRSLSVPRRANTTAELLRANVGKRIRLRDPLRDNALIDGVIDDVLDGALLLRKSDGARASVPLGPATAAIEFVDEPMRELTETIVRPQLTVTLGASGSAPRPQSIPLGMFYLQRGVRWIPSYRIALDGKTGAHAVMQASLLNEAVDLENVTVNFVVGVPRFLFDNDPDPISLTSTLADLGPEFARATRTGNMLSNSVMINAGAMGGGMMGGGRGPGPTDDTDNQERNRPDLVDSARVEDLFVFTRTGIRVGKGERLIVPLTDDTLSYRDVFTLNLDSDWEPTVPSGDSAEDVARQSAAPKVQHVVRLKNTSAHPLTTGPALLQDASGHTLAQTLLRYAPPGGSTDLTLTVAPDVPFTGEETETKRTPAALKVRNHTYTRVDLAGVLKITNRSPRPIALEVTRTIPGTAVTAGGSALTRLSSESAVEGLTRIVWKITVAPGATAALPYTYYRMIE